MDMPPVSVHTWRQCNTLAVARNFYQEDMNILKPRIDRRGSGDGITGMQFPSYEFIVATGYKVLGERHWVARGISLLITSLGILAFFGICLELFKDPRIASIGAWLFAWSPELFYHGINALPDVLALAASVGAFYFYLIWRKTFNTYNFFLSWFLITLAGLTKAQFLLIGAPIAAMTVMDVVKGDKPWKTVLPLTVYGATSVWLTYLWYSYAADLIAISGLQDFAIHAGQSFPESLSKVGSILWNTLIVDIPESLLGYSCFVLLFIGLFGIKKHRASKWAVPFAFWGIMLLVYYVIEIGQFEFHLYYMLPFLPFFALFATLGAARILYGRFKWILLIVLLAAPVHTALKIIPARWVNEKAFPLAEFKDQQLLSELHNTTPTDAYTIVGNDSSGCILFYYLNKKGSAFSSLNELLDNSNGPSKLHQWTEDGAEYLYVNERMILKDERLMPYVDKVLTEVGSFTVIRLKRP